MPERSFYFGDYQFPICSRCTGIICGYLLGLILSLVAAFSKVEIVFAIPMVFDGTIQRFSKYESSNDRRFVTGLLFESFLMRFLISWLKRIAGVFK